ARRQAPEELVLRPHRRVALQGAARLHHPQHPVGAPLQARAAAGHRDHARRRARARHSQGLDSSRSDRSRHGTRRDRGGGRQVLRASRLRQRRDRRCVEPLPGGRPHPRRIDDQPADREERVPVAGRRLLPQGAGGLVHAADRAALGQAADHGGVPQRRRDRDRHLRRGGGQPPLLRPWRRPHDRDRGRPHRRRAAPPQEARRDRPDRLHPPLRQQHPGADGRGPARGARRLPRSRPRGPGRGAGSQGPAEAQPRSGRGAGGGGASARSAARGAGRGGGAGRGSRTDWRHHARARSRGRARTGPGADGRTSAAAGGAAFNL
ncbi:MAG: Monofunctional biosynthetic peptidoglycan transglycosylase, partial [uncultured Sphingomonadaceae bacterium]